MFWQRVRCARSVAGLPVADGSRVKRRIRLFLRSRDARTPRDRPGSERSAWERIGRIWPLARRRLVQSVQLHAARHTWMPCFYFDESGPAQISAKDAGGLTSE